MLNRNLGQFFVLIVLILSCTKIETIGMKDHDFSYASEMIVWIQVPGLHEEHFSLMRFNNKNADNFTSIEKSTCLGKAWNYNLFELRPESYKGFLSQMSGSSNIKGSCQDFERQYVWDILVDRGFPTVILENGTVEKESLNGLWDCLEKDRLKDPGIPFKKPHFSLFRMSKKSEVKTVAPLEFHFELGMPLANNVYYDKSCQSGACYSSTLQNSKALYESLRKKGRKFLLIIRDFSYEKAMKEKKFSKAESILLEIEKIHDFFNRIADTDPTFSLIVSSSGSLIVDFPDQGIQWGDHELMAKGSAIKRSSLMSPIYSKGASAENLCGIYQEQEVFSRIINRPPSRTHFFNLF